MKVSEENFKLVYLLDEQEMAALFRRYFFGEKVKFEDGNNGTPIFCVCIENPDRKFTGGWTLEGIKPIGMSSDGEYRNAKVTGTIDGVPHAFPIADLRHVDVLWPGRTMMTRYYFEQSPKSAEVLRTARPIDQEPEWLKKFIRR
jgi:hypothetical protein